MRLGKMSGPQYLRTGFARITPAVSFLALIAWPGMADEPDRRFADVLQPFLKYYCLDCHGPAKQQAKLDLSKFTSTAAVVKSHRVWERVAERLEAEEMPPAKATRHPKPHERRAVLEWLREVRE